MSPRPTWRVSGGANIPFRPPCLSFCLAWSLRLFLFCCLRLCGFGAGAGWWVQELMRDYYKESPFFWHNMLYARWDQEEEAPGSVEKVIMPALRGACVRVCSYGGSSREPQNSDYGISTTTAPFSSRGWTGVEVACHRQHLRRVWLSALVGRRVLVH